ncbi:MAG: hypothetical protein ACI883_000323 [Candidatus Azotimanducaceae bacterium]|jgi:hypothetical protein|tara:strand:+ start:365 stop:580 length:216 start_codon:yes stop_codon:yes gene_type:complete
MRAAVTAAVTTPMIAPMIAPMAATTTEQERKVTAGEIYLELWQIPSLTLTNVRKNTQQSVFSLTVQSQGWL